MWRPPLTAGLPLAALLIAVLAAVAGPGLERQRNQAHDRTAQSTARTLVAAVQTCRLRSPDYARCNSAAELRAPAVSLGSRAGEARITGAVRDDFVITVRSRSGNDFKVTRTDGGALVRSCSIARRGGCAAGGRW